MNQQPAYLRDSIAERNDTLGLARLGSDGNRWFNTFQNNLAAGAGHSGTFFGYVPRQHVKIYRR